MAHARIIANVGMEIIIQLKGITHALSIHKQKPYAPMDLGF
jgi:hypothetical protein